MLILPEKEEMLLDIVQMEKLIFCVREQQHYIREYIPIAFILYLFPPFNGGYEAMFMPITPDGRLSFAMVILLIMLVYGISNAIGLFTQKKQNLPNMIFGEVIVDSHCPDEVEEPINHGREY